MNVLQRAYEAGKLAAEAAFKPVAAPQPKGPTPQKSETASTNATQQVKPPAKAPADLGLPQVPTLPGMSSSALSTGSSRGPGATAARAVSAPHLNQMSALQFASQTIQGAQNTLGPLAKLSEFNMGMTPNPSTKPDSCPKADNGRRVLGTNFADKPGSHRDINQAFNSLSVQKNHDVVPDMGA